MLKMLFDRDRMYPYPFYIADMVLTSDMQPIVGLNLPMSFAIFEKDRMNMHYEVEALDRMSEQALDRVIHQPGFFQKVMDEIYARSREMEEFSAQTMGLDVKVMTDAQLIDWYAAYIAQTRNLRSWGWIPPMIDGMHKACLSDLLNDEFGAFLKAKGLADKLPEYYSVLSSNDSPSEVQQEELARLELLSEVQNHPDHAGILEKVASKKYQDLEDGYPEVWSRLQRHLKDYGWLTYSYSGPAMTMEQLFKSLKSILDDGGAQEQIRDFHQRYTDIKRQKETLLQQLALPEDLKFLFEVSTGFMAIKDFRKGVYQRSYLAMDKVLGEIASRLGLDLKGIKFMTFEEIKEALRDRQGVEARVEDRLKKCCMLIRDGKTTIYQGEECEKMIKLTLGDLVHEKTGEGIRELKGSVAFVGKAKGVVKIVLVPDDVDKVNEGDILVSSATNPDLIVAMKRAAAFVTDMGGITSHAAIVARELRKPCVVGTKIATKALKDGDIVEVDAEKGIVKIIKN